MNATMDEVEYQNKVARYGIWQWRYDGEYDDEPFGRIFYKNMIWAERKVEKLNDSDMLPIGGYIIRRVWIEKKTKG